MRCQYTSCTVRKPLVFVATTSLLYIMSGAGTTANALQKAAIVVGGTGSVGQLLVDMLVQHPGYHKVAATFRKDKDKALVEKLGAQPVHLDLAGATSVGSLTPLFEGYNTVFFTAGSGNANLQAVDRDGAINVGKALLAYTDKESLLPHPIKPHYVVLSSIGIDQIDKMPDYLQDYGRAKKEADDYIVTELSPMVPVTIVRPAALTNEAACGRIVVQGGRNGPQGERSLLRTQDKDAIKNSRADVAHTMIVCDQVFTDGKARVFEMIQGDTTSGQKYEEALLSML